MPQLQGKAEGKAISEEVKAQLAEARRTGVVSRTSGVGVRRAC